MTDFLFIIRWWFVFLLLGTIFVPFTANLFKNFFDKGYIFSKVIGTIIVSYIIFILGLFHILPFTEFFTYTVIFLIFVVNFFIFKNKYLNIFKQNWMIFLLEEIIFLLGISAWAYVRAHGPDINGLEKFMDFGFVNSALRSKYFPPADMWFTPFSINYYYFGHLTTAVLTKISFISSNITYNLMLASLFAFTFTCSFSIAGNLICFLKSRIQKNNPQINSSIKSEISKFKNRKFEIFTGLLAGFLVSLSGNFEIIYIFFKDFSSDKPLPFWQLPFSLSTFPNNYWYPNATRFILNTIHEFPSYSYVVSDLHGHVLDIPVVLLIVAILMSIFTSPNLLKNSIKIPIGNWKLEVGNSLLLGFLLAVAYMTNVWDAVIYFMLTAAILFGIFLKSYYFSEQKFFTLTDLFKKLTFIFIFFIIFVLPFNWNFKPFASGIGVLCAPEFLTIKEKIGPFLFEKDHCQKSPFWQLLILHGFFYFWAISFAIFLLNKIRIKNSYLRMKNIFLEDGFILILILVSTVLVIIPEFLYLKDIYPAHYRANTMFKLTYQEFMLLSIASSYIFIRIFINIKSRMFKFLNFYFLFIAAGILSFALVFVYPFFAVGPYYNDLKIYKGLDGTKYLATSHPEDYQAILWINKNIKDQPVILEAQGDSYTDYARISANTGLVTILGWTVHEWLWRGTYDIPAPRIAEVQTLYETQDISATKNLIKKYKISYIYVGELEREKYPNLSEDKFKILGKIVYSRGQTRIYKIN